MRLTDLHTIFDHFTITLIILGILSEYYGFITGKENTSSLGWTALRASVGFAIISMLTGFISEGKSFIDPSALPVSSYHKIVSLIMIVVVIASVLIRTSSRENFFTQKGAVYRGAYLALITVALLLTGISSYLGMQMVYVHGVNVRPYEHLLESLPPSAVPAGSLPASGQTTDGQIGTDSSRGN